MYRNSTFSEILKLLDRDIVSKAVKAHNGDRYSKVFNTWNQLVVLLFSQLSGCKSLRDLTIRFNAKSQNLYHLRCKAIKRSTLSDANKHRSSKVFRDIADEIIKSQGREIKEVVSLIDSSPIQIDGRGSEWAYKRTRCGRGLKLHVQSGERGGLIEHISITSPTVNDITEAHNMGIEEGRIYVFDKGYTDYNWWHRIATTKGYFVTRIKTNTAYKIIEERKTEGCSEKIKKDCLIELTNKHPGGGRKNLLSGQKLRLVEVYDEGRKKTYQFISNLLDSKADEIAAYYKQRWSIELLFKWLKQNLKLTTFIAENENAIKTQIYIAIIAYVLINKFKKLCGSVFERTIDLLSWIKIAIFSNHTLLRPPLQGRYMAADAQLSLRGFR